MQFCNWLATVAVLLALLGANGVARAESTGGAEATCPVTPDLAKGAGDQAMLANRHAEALACYEAAYRYTPSPALLYNQARALEFLQRNAEALRQLLQFQQSATEETKARVPQLSQLIESLRGRVGELEITCSVDGADVSLDGTPLGRTPLPEPLLVDPGTVRVRVSDQNHQPYESAVLVNAGEHRVLRVQLEPATAPVAVAAAPAASAREAAPAPLEPARAEPGADSEDVGTTSSTEPARPLRVAAWTALGVGAAGAIFAGVSYGVASSRASDVCGGASECSREAYDASALDSYDTWRGVYTGSLVVASVGLAAGGVLFWLSSTDAAPGDDAKVELGVGVVPRGVLLTGRF